jgi:FtsZ-interacting cell division protein ZipA
MSILVIIGIVILVILISIALSWTTIKKTTINYISRKVLDNVKVDTNPAEMQLSDDKTYGILKYTYLNQNYSIRIPFEKRLLRKIGVTVYHLKDDIETEITNQPGIPILITANALGGGKIIIRKNDDILEEFTGDQIVKF